MTIAEKFEHNGFTVELHYDESPSSPRDNDGNGTFLGFPHRSYTIGDEQVDPSRWEFDCTVCDADGEITSTNVDGKQVTAECKACEGYGRTSVRSFDDAVRYVRENYDAVGPVLNVVMYDHGNVSYSVGRHYDEWDGGNAGLTFYTAKQIKDMGHETQPSDEDLTKWLTGEIDEYSKWASGEVYGYVIKDRNGDDVDSCWGFIGHEYAVEEAKAAVPEAEEMPPPLRTLRLSDRTIAALIAGLEDTTHGATDEPAEVLRVTEAERALEILQGAIAGGDPEGNQMYHQVYTLVAHPPLHNAGVKASFSLTPAARRRFAEQGWHDPSEQWPGTFGGFHADMTPKETA